MFLFNIKVYLLGIFVIVLAITFQYYVSNPKKISPNKSGVLTENELGQYNGNHNKKFFLAVLGTVFDVTEGRKYYSKEGSYHYFVGKDGSRALITGDFKNESDEKDHVLDLTCNNLLDLIHWRKTFKQKYIYVGVLLGRYYDQNGKETEYMQHLKKKLQQCRKEKEEAKKHDEAYPPCNIAWNEKEGTQVWCTNTSGGVVRNWEGVPRQLYMPGEDKSNCVCVQLDKVDNSLMKEYDGCPSLSARCSVQS